MRTLTRSMAFAAIVVFWSAAQDRRRDLAATALSRSPLNSDQWHRTARFAVLSFGLSHRNHPPRRHKRRHRRIRGRQHESSHRRERLLRAAATGGLSSYNLSPCRVLDTRKQAGDLPLNGSLDIDVQGTACGAPSTAQAFVFNSTVVPQGELGYLTLWPQGGTQPVVSTLNALDGTITSNMAIVPTANGSISAFSSGTTHLVLDMSGYFAP